MGLEDGCPGLTVEAKVAMKATNRGIRSEGFCVAIMKAERRTMSEAVQVSCAPPSE